MKSGAHEDWWKGAVMYQIYPRSFQDSSGNGVGDIQGIIDRLDYIASLGVDGIWLSPFFVSPMLDFGYDVADYRAVDPIFGTLDSFKKLVYEAHARGLKLIIDQIYSHTSDQHEWFKESRSSRINSKADWYVWADPKPDGSAPNNWQSFFGGPAWSWDSQRQQYYLHNFLSQQPDLDVRTPAVQEALLDVARFWLDLGIDGFRLDVANFYMCDPLLRDNPPAIYPQEPRPYRYQRHVHDKSHPDNLAFIARLRNLLDSYGARMIVAEIEDDDPIARTAEYTNGPERLHTAYNFVYLAAKGVPDAAMLSGPLKDWNERAGASWPSWAFSNHDVPRVISRWNSELSDQQRAKLYQALLLSLRGTIFIYQGEELGLPQANVPYDRLQDPEAIRFWPLTLGRDGCRTPMVWNAKDPFCDFSTTEPWLPIDPAHRPLAVDQQESDASSVLNCTKNLINIRNQHPALKHGEMTFLETPAPLLAFIRSHQSEQILCLFNLGNKPAQIHKDVLSLSDKIVIPLLCHQQTDMSQNVLELPPASWIFCRTDSARLAKPGAEADVSHRDF